MVDFPPNPGFDYQRVSELNNTGITFFQWSPPWHTHLLGEAEARQLEIHTEAPITKIAHSPQLELRANMAGQSYHVGPRYVGL